MLYDVLQCSWSVSKCKQWKSVTTTGSVHLMILPKRLTDRQGLTFRPEHKRTYDGAQQPTYRSATRNWWHIVQCRQHCRLADSNHGHWQRRPVLTHQACHIFTRPPSRPCGDPPVRDPVKNCNAAAIRDTAALRPAAFYAQPCTIPRPVHTSHLCCLWNYFHMLH